jgi:hypothetical protein
MPLVQIARVNSDAHSDETNEDRAVWMARAHGGFRARPEESSESIISLYHRACAGADHDQILTDDGWQTYAARVQAAAGTFKGH